MLFGDKWLLDNDIITDVTHNNIILNLYANFPVKYVEYFLDQESKSIEVHLYLGWFRYKFKSESALSNKCEDLLKQYLSGYKVITKKRLYERRK